MKEYKTPLDLAGQLVSLPSFVGAGRNETAMIDFLAEFLQETFPAMTMEKQYIREGSPRCNLILKGSGEPKVIVLGHIDTVQPKAGWRIDPLRPVVNDGKLYGLGAADMKGSLAAFLWALASEKQNVELENIMVLLYVDEEYDFKGMRRLVKDSAVTITNPKLLLSLDGGLEVLSGCRGLIELKLLFTGKSGHAANPSSGKNAITGSAEVLQELEKLLRQQRDPELGVTTMNVASIQGGCLNEPGAKGGRWLRRANVIADSAEIILEVRPAITIVSAEYVLNLLRQLSKQRGLVLSAAETRFDFACWPPSYAEERTNVLKRAYKRADMPFVKANRTSQGYIDMQMIAEKINAPAFIIGAGGENKHAANENVPIENLNNCARLFRALLKELL